MSVCLYVLYIVCLYPVSRIPTNIDDLLKHEGFFKTMEKAADCEKRLESEAFSVVLGTPSLV